jgi:hypothetical protein
MERAASSDVLPAGPPSMAGMVFNPDHGCLFSPDMGVDEQDSELLACPFCRRRDSSRTSPPPLPFTAPETVQMTRWMRP